MNINKESDITLLYLPLRISSLVMDDRGLTDFLVELALRVTQNKESTTSAVTVSDWLRLTSGMGLGQSTARFTGAASLSQPQAICDVRSCRFSTYWASLARFYWITLSVFTITFLTALHCPDHIYFLLFAKKKPIYLTLLPLRGL